MSLVCLPLLVAQFVSLQRHLFSLVGLRWRIRFLEVVIIASQLKRV
jgi:hypothetical protein